MSVQWTRKGLLSASSASLTGLRPRVSAIGPQKQHAMPITTRYSALLILITAGVVENASVISGMAARMLVVDMDAMRPQLATKRVMDFFCAWLNLSYAELIVRPEPVSTLSRTVCGLLAHPFAVSSGSLTRGGASTMVDDIMLRQLNETQ